MVDFQRSSRARGYTAIQGLILCGAALALWVAAARSTAEADEPQWQLTFKLKRATDLKFDRVPLQDVLDAISKRHGVTFTRSFDRKLTTVPVSFQGSDATLDDLLRGILSPLGLQATRRFEHLMIAARPLQATHLRQRLLKPATLKFNQVPLHEALASTAKKYEISIRYVPGEENLRDRPVTVSESGAPLSVALRRMLQPLGLTYAIHRHELVVTSKGTVSAEDRAAFEVLEQPITGKWRRVPLQTVLRDLSVQQGVEILCDQAVLPEVDRQMTINLAAVDLPLQRLLEQMLDPLGYVARVDRGRILVQAWPATTQRDETLERILREPAQFDFVELPLSTALATLAAQHRIKIYKVFPDDNDATFNWSTPVTLKSGDRTLRGALRRLLEPLQLTIEIRDGALWVVQVPDPE